MLRSLEEFSSLSGRWHLELFEQSCHEPVISGALGEVHVTLSLDNDDFFRSRDLRDVILGLATWADVVSRANEEAHGDSVDLGHIDEIGLLHAVEPLVLELLEQVLETVHDPVLLRLDRLALTACDRGEILADDITESVTDLWKFSVPIRTVDRVETLLLHVGYRVSVVDLHGVRGVHNEARGQVHDFVQVLAVVALVVVG